MSRQGGMSSSVQVTGVKELSKFLTEQIAREDLNPANRMLRQGTQEIARDILIPAIKANAASNPTPQAKAVAATTKTRSDRIVFVNAGRTNPKLSGYKRGTPQRQRTSLAFGSDLGPHPKSKVNHYGVPRNESSYWFRKTVSDPAVFQKVKAAYDELLGRVLRSYGRY